PGFRHIDRRRMVQLESDRDTTLESLRPIFELTSSRTNEALATRGNRLALVRNLWIGAERDAGSSEVEWLTILEGDGSGASPAAVTLDSDDLDAAYAELDARYAAGEAAHYRGIWELRIARAVAKRDWNGLASMFAPDCVIEDHRPVGLLTLRSGDEYVASV